MATTINRLRQIQLKRTGPELAGKRNRCCDLCGEPYLRRNLIEVWTLRNEGHRMGWTKVKVKQCLRCMRAEHARRVLMASHVKPTVAMFEMPKHMLVGRY